MYNLDIKPGQITKVLSILQTFYLAHTSVSICILCVALRPYVSMGIVAYLGQLPAINNVWTDWVLITIIVGNICQSLSFCWPMSARIQFGLYPLLYWSEDPQVRSTSFLTHIGWMTWFNYLCQWLCLLWQLLTIIFMACGTMLILHSSVTFYSVNRLLCFLFIFVSFGKLIKPYISCIQLLISSLFCMGANKVLHVFSVWKMIMIGLFLFGHDSLFSYRITHIYLLWFYKNKVHGTLLPCAVCSFRVLLFLCLVLPVVALPMVIQWSFPLRGTKLLRWLYESLIMDAMFVLPGIFCRLNLSKFPARETNASYYYLVETLSSLTQTSFGSK